MNQLLKKTKDQRGIAALLTIIIVGAASLIMAYTASQLGLGELEMGYDSQKGSEVFFASEGCIEESLRRLKKDEFYSGGSLNLTSGSCIISVSDFGGSKIVIATATIDNYSKTVKIDITLNNGDVTINSWDNL